MHDIHCHFGESSKLESRGIFKNGMHDIHCHVDGKRDGEHAGEDPGVPRGDLGHASCQDAETAETYLGGKANDAVMTVGTMQGST